VQFNVNTIFTHTRAHVIIYSIETKWFLAKYGSNIMGWTSSWAWNRKEKIVEHVISAEMWGANFSILEHTVRGNRVWVLAEYAQGEKVGQRFIALFLLSYHDREWAYKDMDESCGPCQYDCPISFIKRAREVDAPIGDYAKEWREKVIQYHTNKNANRKRKAVLKPGMKLQYQRNVYELIEKCSGRLGWNVRDVATNNEYRLMSKQVTAAQLVA
jgi:hypothetical protein